MGTPQAECARSRQPRASEARPDGQRASRFAQQTGAPNVPTIDPMRSAWIAFAVTMSVTAAGLVQTPDRPAQDVFRNIQVLTGRPASTVQPLMLEFSKALGVDCTY